MHISEESRAAVTLETKGGRLFRVPVTPQRGADRAQKALHVPTHGPGLPTPVGPDIRTAGTEFPRAGQLPSRGLVSVAWKPPPVPLRGGSSGPPCSPEDRHLGCGPKAGTGITCGPSHSPTLSQQLEVRSSALQGPLASRGQGPRPDAPGWLLGDLVWGLASLPLGSLPSRQRRRGAMGTRGACPSGHPSSPSGFPVGPWVYSPRRALGPRSVPDLEEEVVHWGERSVGAGWSQPECLFAFQASRLLRSLDLVLAPVPAFFPARSSQGTRPRKPAAE